MKKVIIIFCSILSFQLNAQDVSFSQFDLNMLYMNPALAGFEQDKRGFLFDLQWKKLILKDLSVYSFLITCNMH